MTNQNKRCKFPANSSLRDAGAVKLELEYAGHGALRWLKHRKKLLDLNTSASCATLSLSHLLGGLDFSGKVQLSFLA